MEPDGLTKLEGWARDGLTYEQIAHNIGVSIKTLSVWRTRYVPISAALKKGKEVVDIEVENALLKRALGYTYDEITYENSTETKRVRKAVLPDTTAQIFWLKNRKPDVWRDRKDIAMNAKVKNENPFEGMTTEELRKIVNSGD